MTTYIHPLCRRARSGFPHSESPHIMSDLPQIIRDGRLVRPRNPYYNAHNIAGVHPIMVDMEPPSDLLKDWQGCVISQSANTAQWFAEEPIRRPVFLDAQRGISEIEYEETGEGISSVASAEAEKIEHKRHKHVLDSIDVSTLRYSLEAAPVTADIHHTALRTLLESNPWVGYGIKGSLWGIRLTNKGLVLGAADGFTSKDSFINFERKFLAMHEEGRVVLGILSFWGFWRTRWVAALSIPRSFMQKAYQDDFLRLLKDVAPPVFQRRSIVEREKEFGPGTKIDPVWPRRLPRLQRMLFERAEQRNITERKIEHDNFSVFPGSATAYASFIALGKGLLA